MHVRWMIRRDLAEVLTLDATTGEQWGEATLLEHLRRRTIISMVSEQNEAVTGFMVYELCPDHLEVLRLVGESQAVLAGLLRKLRSKLSTHRRHYFTCPALETNTFLMRALFDAGGAVTGVERGGTEPDTYLFTVKEYSHAQ